MTPERFRIGGWGVDLSDVEDVELRAILTRATAMANEYCTVPQIGGPHDFRGGLIVDEAVPWSNGSSMLPGQRRAYPAHTPVLSVDAFRIDVTNDQYLSFDPGEMYVTDHYLEVTSLSTTGYGLFGTTVLPFVGLSDPVGRASYHYGRVIPEMGEVLEQTDARLYRAMNQWWWDDPEPVVRVDGVVADVDDYSLDMDEGTVLFDTAPAAGAIVDVDYAHKLPQAIAEAVGMIAVDRVGERDLTRKGLHGLVELAVGEVRIRRDFPRAGVQKVGVSDQVQQLLQPYKFITVRGGSY